MQISFCGATSSAYLRLFISVSLSWWRPYARDQETNCVGVGCFRQSRQYHEDAARQTWRPRGRFSMSMWSLIVMTYESETWTLATAQMDALAVGQRKMERIMLGITLRDRKHNAWIRQQTGVTDIIDTIKSSKHQWAGHVARLQDNRWTIRATDWLPGEWIRSRSKETKSATERWPC